MVSFLHGYQLPQVFPRAQSRVLFFSYFILITFPPLFLIAKSANDITIYKEISSPDDVKLLQPDLSNIVQWAKKWLLHLNPLKYDNIVISNKRPSIVPSYNLDSSVTFLLDILEFLSIQNSTGMNIVNTFQQKPQDHLTFFITVYIMLLLQLNLLLIDVSSALC